jgi:hypothetical protein
MAAKGDDMRYIALIVLVLALAACGATASSPLSSSTSSHAPVSSAPASTSASSGYPQEAADKQLCAEWNTDSAQGDLQAVAEAAQQAEGSASPALMNDILYAENNPGTIQQDEQNDVYIAMDCAIVAAGRPPVELRKG